MRAPLRPALLAGICLTVLSACDEPFDFDLRSLGDTFDTSEAVQNMAPRPSPDDRGVISYPNYQVAVAQRGDTVRSMATRLGLNANTLADYNGIGADVELRRDEIIALPSRVSEPSPATGSIGTGPIQPPTIDVTTLASNAIDRAGEQTITPAPISEPLSITRSTTPQTGAEPTRHHVQRGETAYQIARRYNVPVRGLAQWNGLGSDLAIREGQYLLIPVAGATAPTSVTAPGQGSATPVPPSAETPLPDDDTATPTAAAAATVTPPTPDIGRTTQASGNQNAQLGRPVTGTIIRAYSKGSNEGIDIGVAAGTSVNAAAAGTVAAVTTDTNGVAIVVIKHANNLLTVYTNLEGLTVAKGDTVTRGQTIAKVRAGSPSFLHFEVRQGLESVDPADYLP